MTIRPARTPTLAELRRAQEHYRLLRTELTRVRAAALAWRNGLAALLAGLLGFGLIRGRSDVGDLRSGWGAAVGVLLLGSLIVGACAALALLRAGHGRPGVVKTADLPPPDAADHLEALASARALRAGIALAFGCAALLVAAVATTWYGPERDAPDLRIRTGTTTVCGTAAGVSAGKVTIEHDTEITTVDLGTVQDLRPVNGCPKS